MAPSPRRVMSFIYYSILIWNEAEFQYDRLRGCLVQGDSIERLKSEYDNYPLSFVSAVDDFTDIRG